MNEDDIGARQQLETHLCDLLARKLLQLLGHCRGWRRVWTGIKVGGESRRARGAGGQDIRCYCTRVNHGQSDQGGAMSGERVNRVDLGTTGKAVPVRHRRLPSM